MQQISLLPITRERREVREIDWGSKRERERERERKRERGICEEKT